MMPAVQVIAAGLCDLGLLPDALPTIESGGYQRFFMHRPGAGCGLDVHDVGDYRVDGESPLLEPGIVVTFEPDCTCPSTPMTCLRAIAASVLASRTTWR